jgi:DNA-binding protein H-NS
MGMVDLNTASLKELKELQAQVVKAIASFEDRKKLETLARLRELARSEGFQLEELTSMTATRKRAPSAVTFANPADASDTWSGRGRKPRWFIEAIASGKSRDDLLV